MGGGRFTAAVWRGGCGAVQMLGAVGSPARGGGGVRGTGEGRAGQRAGQAGFRKGGGEARRGERTVDT